MICALEVPSSDAPEKTNAFPYRVLTWSSKGNKTHLPNKDPG